MKNIKKNDALCFFCSKAPTEYTMKISDERYSSIPFLIYMCKKCSNENSHLEVEDNDRKGKNKNK